MNAQHTQFDTGIKNTKTDYEKELGQELISAAVRNQLLSEQLQSIEETLTKALRGETEQNTTFLPIGSHLKIISDIQNTLLISGMVGSIPERQLMH